MSRAKSCTLSMQEWFQKATPLECDAMSARQLDYRFTGDTLYMWWPILQELGFKHKERSYELPASAPASISQTTYSGNEIYQCLDRFALPILSSPFACCPPRASKSMNKEEEDWWRNIRDELLFRKFHPDFEKLQGQQSGSKKAKANSSSRQVQKTAKKQKRAADKDSGVGKTKLGKENSQNCQIDVSMDMEENFPTLEEYAESAASFDLSEVKRREETYALDFKEWKYFSILNHSLLFYGVGSKRTLLNRFADEELQNEGDILVIDGFDKFVTIEGILDLIVDHWLGKSRPSFNRYDAHVNRGGDTDDDPFGMHLYPQSGDLSMVQQAIVIAQELASIVSTTLRPLCLVIHNIDGIGLRNSTAQEALASLVFYSKTTRGLNAIRLVASLDHVNAPALLWDSLTYARFRWIWKPMHTHRPYVEEVTRSKFPSFLPRKTKRNHVLHTIDEDSIFSVLKSLASKHAEALQVLAQMQLRAKGEEEENWINYKEFLGRSQLDMILSKDQDLRKVLGELIDHGIVEKTTTSTAKIRIPCTEGVLKRILEFVVLK